MAVSLRLPEDLSQRLSNLAAQTGRSKTALLHKSSLRRVTPNPSRGYATAAV